MTKSLQFTFNISHFTLISQLSFIKHRKLGIVNLLKIVNCKLKIALKKKDIAWNPSAL